MRTSAGVFDVSHMGELVLDGDGAHELPPGAALERPRPDRPRTGAVHAAHERARRDHRRPDRVSSRRRRLPARRQRVERRARPRRARRDRDVSDEWALLAVQGPEALERLGIEIAPFTFREGRRARRPVPVGGTGYTGERRLRARLRARRCGRPLGRDPRARDRAVRARRARHAAPRGLLSAPRERHRARAHADRGRTRLGVRARQGVHGRRRASPREGGGPREKLVAFVMDEKGIPRQGMAVAEGGEVTSGTLSPMLDAGIGLAYVPAGLAEPGTEITVDLRGRAAPGAISSRSRSTSERSLVARGELSGRTAYHPEHDWARIDGDDGDARDHLVRPGRAGRDRPLRAARGRARRSRRTRATARSSR